MLMTVIAFLSFSLVAIFGIVNPTLRHSRSLLSLERTKSGYYLSEAGIEDVAYRLKTNKPVGSSNTLSIDGMDTVTTVADNGNGKTITSTGDYKEYIRKIETKLVFGTGMSFFYGLQTGTGGITMANNSQVIGNVYANGSINGSNGASITGSAYASNASNPIADQVNDTPFPAPSSVQFGQNSGSEDVAQSFVLSTSDKVTSVSVLLSKVGAPSNLTVHIVSDSSGSPGSSLAQGTLSAALITGTQGWVNIPITSSPTLNAGTTYWLILDGDNHSSKYYVSGANTTYSDGLAKIGRFGSSWNNTSPLSDLYFKIFLGGSVSTIDNIIVGSGGVGEAHANTVTNSTIAGNLYCESGTNNNKSCNTSLPDPSPEAFPISDANIQEWKDAAVAGGTTNGNVVIDGTSTSIGPRKIVGELTLTNNAVLTITGTIWVTGKITISNGSIVRLSSSYGTGSGVVTTDNFVDLSNNALFQGSGQTGSYVMLISTLDCPGGSGCNSDNAISVGNNAGAVILNAQKAGVSFSNNAGAKSAVAKKINLDNNAVISYDSGLVNVNFVSGPSGGFDILSWKEIE